MEELRFSVDEEKYDDRHGQVLSLSGWCVSPGYGEFRFRLLGDGREEICIPEAERHARPDVGQALSLDFEDFLPGFTVTIPEAGKLAEQFGTLELFLETGEQRASVWKRESGELKAFLQECLIEYHIDRAEILYDTMLEIQGWVMDQRGDAEVKLLNTDGSPVPCRLSRGRRPDVVERRNLDNDYKTREIGFRISASAEEIKGKKAVLKFSGTSAEKSYEIDIQKLRREKKPEGFFGRFKKNEKGSREDYEEWRKSRSLSRFEGWKQKRAAFSYAPVISIVIPLYNTPLPYLDELLKSIQGQTYRKWQLCLADGSTDDKVRFHLKKHYGREKRISYKKLRENK